MFKMNDEITITGSGWFTTTDTFRPRSIEGTMDLNQVIEEMKDPAKIFAESPTITTR